ncbi:MAG: hypothetical protein WD066_10575 [Planctomycetaceae bacterium]
MTKNEPSKSFRFAATLFHVRTFCANSQPRMAPMGTDAKTIRADAAWIAGDSGTLIFADDPADASSCAGLLFFIATSPEWRDGRFGLSVP